MYHTLYIYVCNYNFYEGNFVHKLRNYLFILVANLRQSDWNEGNYLQKKSIAEVPTRR